MKKIALTVLIILCLGSFLNVLKVFRQGSWPDFSISYHSANVALHGINPYTLQGIFIGGFLYPLAIIPYLVAGKIWATVSIVCLIAALDTQVDMFGSESESE